MLEEWIPSGLTFAILFYGTVSVLLFLGLKRDKLAHEGRSPLVSVIVAARNEEANLPHLLDGLLKQSYMPFEVILVDDQSSDQTLSIAKERAAKNPILKVLSMDPPVATLARKKSALTRGILASKGEILCFTDADCLPGRDWLSAIVRHFGENVGLVAGYSPYDSSLLPVEKAPSVFTSLLHDFIRYEEIKGAIWSAGSIGLGIGWLCTGRNLAYRRRVWDEVSGFTAIMDSISGDDDLFLQQVRRSTTWDISYLFDPRSFVRTAPPDSFRSFIAQRKRHFSAGKYFTPLMKAFFVLFHGSNLFLFLGLLLSMFLPELFTTAVTLFFGKLLVDLMLVMRGASLLSEKVSWVQIIPMELLYLFYNSFIGPMGFLTDFEWKPDPTS